MGCYPIPCHVDAIGPGVWQAEFTRHVSTGARTPSRSRSILELGRALPGRIIQTIPFSKKDLEQAGGMLAVEGSFELSCSASSDTMGYPRVPVAIANRMRNDSNSQTGWRGLRPLCHAGIHGNDTVKAFAVSVVQRLMPSSSS